MVKLVIIDDDPICNFLTDNHMKKADPNVVTKIFTDPLKALSELNASSYDPEIVIILDINMPELNGWELVELLTHKFTIYMLSSSISPADMNKCQNYSNIKGFISKPMTPEFGKLILNQSNLFYQKL